MRVTGDETTGGVPSRVRDFRTLAAVFLVAALASRVTGPGGPLYWDSFGYVAQAITGRAGGLALGRPGFVLASHAMARAFFALGGSSSRLEAALRVVWLLVSALGAPGVYVLSRSLGLRGRAPLYAALVFALSPAMAHTSDAVLTDAPSVSVAVWSLALAARGSGLFTALASGALLGIAFGLREQSVALIPSIVLALGLARRPVKTRVAHVAAALAGAALVGALPVAYCALTQRDYVPSIHRWVHAMRAERAQHPYQPRDFAIYLGWLVALSPAGIFAAARSWSRVTRWGLDAPAPWWRDRSVLVCALALAQLLALAFYQDISFSPRYLLPALAGAVALPAGLALAPLRARTVYALLAAPLLVTALGLRIGGARLRRVLDETPALVAALPADSVVITGQPCPAVSLSVDLAKREGNTLRVETVCAGWSWPRDLSAHLDALRARGSTVVLDLRDEAWLGPRQRAARDEARAYADAHPGEVRVWRGETQ